MPQAQPTTSGLPHQGDHFKGRDMGMGWYMQAGGGNPQTRCNACDTAPNNGALQTVGTAGKTMNKPEKPKRAPEDKAASQTQRNGADAR